MQKHDEDPKLTIGNERKCERTVQICITGIVNVRIFLASESDKYMEQIIIMKFVLCKYILIEMFMFD